MSKMRSVGLVAFLIVGAVGCGTGAILFQEKNGGPPGSKGTTAQQFDLDCEDKVTPNKEGSYLLDGEKVDYDENCTYKGQSMPWKRLGFFHCAPLAHGKWAQYRREVAEKASNKGCPGIAIRKTPPRVNDGGEAIGAYCVDPAQKE